MTDYTIRRIREARARILDQLAHSRESTAGIERELADCDRALAGDEVAAARVLDDGTTVVPVDELPAKHTDRARTVPPPHRDYPGSRPPRRDSDGT